MCHERIDIDRRVDGRAALWVLPILLSCAIGIAGAATVVPEDAAAFDLKEISTFDVPDAEKSSFLFGVLVACETEPDAKAVRYPALQSDKPLYGSFHVGASDMELDAGYHYRFAMDESAGAGRGYDRMYIDMNCNGDLTDDGVCSPMKDVPAKALFEFGSDATQVCFETIRLQIVPGEDPSQGLEVMPRLLVLGDRRYAVLTTMKARTGEIRIGENKFTAVLGHSGAIPGRFDHPETGLFLFAANGPSDRSLASWYGGDRLMAMHRAGDTYYRLAATPSGDKLFVWPCRGPFGTLELKAGQRKVQNVSFSGTLGSKDMAISLTDGLGGQDLPPSKSFRLPVGDYTPLLMSVSYDALSCLILRNRHADGLVGGRARQGPAIYAVQIREDKPFVLDFSGQPQVVFASPARGHRVKPGSDLEVKAVLIDPSLDVMFRRIGRDDSFNPRVVIKRSNGEIVAEGVMPFG